ncbi:MAG: YdcF family protein [Clostridia bacterium]
MNDDLRLLWDFLYHEDELEKADLILGFGCNDLGVAERAAKLYQQGWAPLVMFSGGLGKGTEGFWGKSEAETFAERAMALGVPKDKLLLETRSTNTGENLRFSRQLLAERALAPRKVIVVHHPGMGRRIAASLQKQWANDGVRFLIAPGKITLEEQLERLERTGVAREEIVNNIVGDVWRMDAYARLGYQAPMEIPQDLWAALKRLAAQGYTKYLTKL